MRKIILHSPAIDRHGKWRDAGSELTVGADENTDTDISTARADELINGLRAVSATTAAEEEKAESIEPSTAAPARKPRT